ncbi:hypothetical protein ALC53_00209 [Atta colombica]|uniref:Transposable element P transposase-like RNase H domain-containing protein n=1 Tax=Atta colombica TaxID=520822 RepID=A0A195BZD0_9HYME|nr:hypothetical protein ALC53_00209 [Atta colombica]
MDAYFCVRVVKENQYGKHMNDIDLSKACLTAFNIIVLMVVDINGHWKLPIAYFINSLGSMERTNTYIH